MEKKWKNIEPGVWKPDQKGDSIEGVLVNKVPKDEDAGMSARYYLKNEKGTFFVWGSAVLDDRMQYVNVGQEVKITYDGQDTNKKNQKINLYKVAVANSEENATSANKKDNIDVEEETID